MGVDPSGCGGPRILVLEDDLLGETYPATAVFDGPRDAQPSSLGQLLLPFDANVPRGVVGRAADSAVRRELAGQMLREPRAHFFAEVSDAGRQVEFH